MPPPGCLLDGRHNACSSATYARAEPALARLTSSCDTRSAGRARANGQAVGSGNHIVGTFVGGTGRYAGVTGDYSFQWQYVVDTEDGAVSGRVVDLKGRARLARLLPRRAAGSRARRMNAAPANFRKLGKQVFSFVLVLGIWFSPIPPG